MPDAERLIFNEPWHSYTVRDASLAGLHCTCDLFFHEDRLIELRFYRSQSGETDYWQNWTEARVKADKAAHDAWIESLLGPLPSRGALLERFVGPPSYRVNWGHMASLMDEKAGYPLIYVSLNPRPTAQS